MGKYTPQKREFDELTKHFFESRGYEAELVGGSLADVVAWKPVTKEFSIVEVKSPAERDAAIHFDSEHSYVDVNGLTREEIWNLIKEQDFATESPGMARLVAFTVTSQLYTYWLKREEHLKRFKRKKRKEISPLQVRASLVMPVESRAFTVRILESLRNAGLVAAFSPTDWQKLCVVEIEYPSPASECEPGRS